MKLVEYSLERQRELLVEYPHQPLKGQVALVTGANSGIGEGCVRHLAAAGAAVVINYVSKPEGAQAIADQIKQAGGTATAFPADVSDEGQVAAMFEHVRSAHGTLDILVANAGLQRDSLIGDMTLAQWDMVMNVNLKGQFLCSKQAVLEFRRRGPHAASRALGKIVCMSSVHQVIPWAKHTNYAASKGGVMLFMQSLAQEVSAEKIRVNGIAPGAIATPINRDAWETPEAEAALLKLIPYDRVGVPDDIGRAAVWLSSDASDYVVGSTLFVDGAMCTFESFSTGG
jgi:glucose 1-dehydrogenase